MTANSPAHPHDLLEAFALDALDADEEAAVLQHVEDCFDCASVVDGHLLTAAALARAAPPQGPPERVRTALMASVELSGPPPQKVSVSPPRPSRGWAGLYSALGRRWARFLMPVAAVAVIAVAIAFNVQVSGRMDDVKQENNLLREEMGQNRATSTAQLALASDTVTQMQGSLQLLQNTLAQPGNRSLTMNSMQPGSPAKGVLVMSSDGKACVVLASELEPPEDGSAYHVWFTRGGEGTWGGGMEVDEYGWGTIALEMDDSMAQMDTVQLRRGPLALASVGVVGDIVLEVSLP